MHGVFDLLTASGAVYSTVLKENQIAVFEEMKNSALSIFEQIGHPQGLADVYFCWARLESYLHNRE